MKKLNLLWLAAVLALVAALVGCQQDSGGNSGGSSVSIPSLPAAAGNVNDIQSFTTGATAPADEDAAMDLLDKVLDNNEFGLGRILGNLNK